jgi:hypothetical protein
LNTTKLFYPQYYNNKIVVSIYDLRINPKDCKITHSKLDTSPTDTCF